MSETKFVSPWDPPTWVRRAVIGFWCSVGVLLLAGVYLGIYAADRVWIGSDVANRVAFTTVDGREVMVFAWTSDGPEGITDLPRSMKEPKRERASAIDTTTHEVLWDTVIVDYYATRHSAVLAADERFTYVATERGLAILDTATGELHAGVDEVKGIGHDRVRAVGAYDYDEETRSVVARLDDDTVVAIPVGSDEARPAPAAVSQRWAGPLKDADRDWADSEAPGLHDGIVAPSGIHVENVTDPDLDTLIFHDRPSDGGCYDDVCWNEEDGVRVTIGGHDFWSW